MQLFWFANFSLSYNRLCEWIISSPCRRGMSATLPGSLVFFLLSLWFFFLLAAVNIICMPSIFLNLYYLHLLMPFNHRCVWSDSTLFLIFVLLLRIPRLLPWPSHTDLPLFFSEYFRFFLNKLHWLLRILSGYFLLENCIEFFLIGRHFIWGL